MTISSSSEKPGGEVASDELATVVIRASEPRVRLHDGTSTTDPRLAYLSGIAEGYARGWVEAIEKMFEELCR